MDKPEVIVLCGIVLSLTFGIGYVVGADHEHANRVALTVQEGCITPGQIKKLYYDYSSRDRRLLK